MVVKETTRSLYPREREQISIVPRNWVDPSVGLAPKQYLIKNINYLARNYALFSVKILMVIRLIDVCNV